VLGSGPQWVTPCGGCRQKIHEFAAPHTPVWVANEGGVLARLTLDGLLPHSFGPDHLNTAMHPTNPHPRDPA